MRQSRYEIIVLEEAAEIRSAFHPLPQLHLFLILTEDSSALLCLFLLLSKKCFVPVQGAVKLKPKWNQTDRSTVPSVPGLCAWALPRKRKAAFFFNLYFTF